MARSRSRRPTPAPSATSVAFDREVVVYCERTEQMHCLDSSASLVWVLCDGTRDLVQITAEVAALAGVESHELRAEVDQAVQQFRDLGLLR